MKPKLGLLTTCVSVLTLFNAARAYATPGLELFAQGGDVQVTFEGGGGLFDDYLFLASPVPSPPFLPAPANSFNVNPANYLFYQHVASAGQTVDLGTFAAGTELEFGLYVEEPAGFGYPNGNPGQNFDTTYYTGPGSRNPDGAAHANVLNNFYGPNTAFVGFEDWSDFQYEDLQFKFAGLQGAAAAPDGGMTIAMLGLSLSGLAFIRRKFASGSVRISRTPTADDWRLQPEGPRPDL